MRAAGRTQSRHHETDRSADPSRSRASPADPVLAAEREHLTASREFLRLMREHVLSLPAMAGDRVSEEYLKADLYRRSEALRDIPDAPLFFGRLDYRPGAAPGEGADQAPAGTGPAGQAADGTAAAGGTGAAGGT
ncbi:MAG: hypothetical protein J2P33_00610, partial [Actinobacteria bacterium]|nr:hypothetical protein [Actinomycetota bacterium]